MKKKGAKELVGQKRNCEFFSGTLKIKTCVFGSVEANLRAGNHVGACTFWTRPKDSSSTFQISLPSALYFLH